MRRRELLVALGIGLAGCTAGGPETTDGDQGSGATVTGDGSRSPTAPLVDWQFSLDASLERATVTHAGGEVLTTETTDRVQLVHTTGPDHPIPTDATLTPTRTPVVSRWTWREIGGDPYPIRKGDAVQVPGVTPGDTLAVWWYGTESHRDGTMIESISWDPVEA